MKSTKNMISLLLVLTFLLGGLCACGSGSGSKDEVEKRTFDDSYIDVRVKFLALLAEYDDLGSITEYSSVEKIPGGTIDPELVGRWWIYESRAEEEYTEDGRDIYLPNSFEAVYTTVALDSRSYICKDDVYPQYTLRSYNAYDIDDDLLFTTEVVEDCDSYVYDTYSDTNEPRFYLYIYYREDENGGIEKLFAETKFSPDSLKGTWTYDKGTAVIDGGVIEIAGKQYQFDLMSNMDLILKNNGEDEYYQWYLSYYCVPDDRTKDYLSLSIYFDPKYKNPTACLQDLMTETSYGEYKLELTMPVNQ